METWLSGFHKLFTRVTPMSLFGLLSGYSMNPFTICFTLFPRLIIYSGRILFFALWVNRRGGIYHFCISGETARHRNDIQQWLAFLFFLLALKQTWRVSATFLLRARARARERRRRETLLAEYEINGSLWGKRLVLSSLR